MIDPYTLQMTYINANSIGLTPEVREREYNNYYSQNTNQGTLCPMCKGDKNYTMKKFTTSFPYDKYCSECHETIPAGIVAHIHQKCNACWGNGYIK